MQKSSNLKSTLFQYKYAIACAAFILFATLSSSATLESLSLQSLFSLDKPIHIILFAIQTWLFIRAENSYRQKTINISCIAVILFGLATEIMQGLLTASRTFDWFDIGADAIGCMVVWAWFRIKPFAQ